MLTQHKINNKQVWLKDFNSFDQTHDMKIKHVKSTIKNIYLYAHFFNSF